VVVVPGLNTGVLVEGRRAKLVLVLKVIAMMTAVAEI
jgi:hypothetical protein